MAEANNLASRVGILVNGALRCLGEPMHIKDVYGSGYHLELMLELPGSSTTTSPGPEDLSETAADSEAGTAIEAPKKKLTAENVEELILKSLQAGLSTAQGVDEQPPFAVLEKVVINPKKVKLVIGLGVKNIDEVVQQKEVSKKNIGPDHSAVDAAHHEDSEEEDVIPSASCSSPTKKKKVDAKKKINLSKVFRWCLRDTFKEHPEFEGGVHLEDYIVGEPTLEQVFLRFAKQQEDLDSGESSAAVLREGPASTTSVSPVVGNTNTNTANAAADPIAADPKASAAAEVDGGGGPVVF